MSLEDDCVHAVEIGGIYECGDANPAKLCIPGGNNCVKYEIVTKYFADMARTRTSRNGYGTVEPIGSSDKFWGVVIATIAAAVIVAKVLHHIIST